MQTNVQTAIIGGGAAGLFLAASLSTKYGAIALFERGERVGRKLSATGNGQGNITHRAPEKTPYFSSEKEGITLAQTLVEKRDDNALCDFFQSLGILVVFDERGRGYPTGRQASSLTDALRFYVEERGVQTHVNCTVTKIEKVDGAFRLTCLDGKTFTAQRVALCTGGKAAKNFGTDGSAYALAQSFGHTVTPLYPSLVQLKTDTAAIRSLKGVRVFDAQVTAKWQEGKVEKTHTLRGDILFTDYGVSGDAIFRLSAFIADKKGASLSIDFLPDVSAQTLRLTLERKTRAFPRRERGELLCGIVNNPLGRAIMKRVQNGEDAAVVACVKAFTLAVQGTLGFDYAQVTKGGIPVTEVDEQLQSRKAEGLYFAGEILDIDGECGGYNLHWAYASACAVAAAIDAKNEKARG